MVRIRWDRKLYIGTLVNLVKSNAVLKAITRGLYIRINWEGSMKKIGITGGVGSGKSDILAFLRQEYKG